MAKTREPLVMPPDVEIKILSMQDLGFGLIVKYVRRVAFKVVEAAVTTGRFKWLVGIGGQVEGTIQLVTEDNTKSFNL